MKRKTFSLTLLLLVLVSSTLSAATYTTSKTVSIQGFTVTARVLWDYETGNYVGKAEHSVIKKPSGILTISNLEYMLTHKTSSSNITQYFRPTYYNVLGQSTSKGSEFPVTLRSSGPRSLK